MQDAQVYKANALVEASYRLSLYEQRIILACIAQVRRDKPLTDQQLYTVSAQQIADMAKISVDRAYQHIKTASERLFDRRVTLHEAPNGNGHAKVRLTRWVQEVVYQETLGTVALRFSQPMVPYLSQLTEQFTRYALADVAKMTSAHAVRLYELLAQWRGSGKREVEIEWLREAFQLGEKYPAIKDFKRWVIQPAIDQINEHSPLWVNWEQKKTGRKITHLAFSFGEKIQEIRHKPQKGKSKGKAGKEPKNGSGALYGIPMPVIEKMAQPGESYEDAALRLLDESKRGA
ncbi:RepB family plasmid replication initiator protein [Larsenimonas rhizosphaerae]|uniref:RepB family plasmid replication initiator protein n=1 Tax=Larsenimonas rhizosphaerae TaxID=2944682 RepID=UPI002033F7D1|nr:RepB family plasmid replication initiator protein [Larsenimonas rhizosphaerae]MCM2132234.1 replication initiation protein [Larsenimonas rhizosphaerae]